ncbi:ubiquitin and WLM domain-containing protein [Trifolium pratense]|uniref:Ubiquitin and WLM domain-containing protein n=1 Tax=Trifolium pratense TaxID=57577 RepID=A0A2K3NQM6_TRIPR|nr:ubiquitin and WLM domain-containing protein [Trifolium pratense]
MPTSSRSINISVTWRGKKFVVDMNLDATVKDLGEELQKLTNIKQDTMKLIVPQIAGKTSKLLAPFSTEHALLSLQETSITEWCWLVSLEYASLKVSGSIPPGANFDGLSPYRAKNFGFKWDPRKWAARSILMMGASTNEVEEVLKNAEANLRIAGFEDEEKRLKQKISHGPRVSLKLPQGPYIFCEFRTLEIPGLKLNPPPSEALKRMHMLAADPGIVAIMNKHRWRVGIMTEMAPIGYVGVSPKCILGFNKNHGEEISLRLRTDDLKGFRKYESIKKTLLHELAHMIHSEHDANFYALDKQLNQEAASLDWTKSAGHTLSGVRSSEIFEDDFIEDSSNIPQKLGGSRSDQLMSARESSIIAAYHRMATVSTNKSGGSEVNQELDHDYSNADTREQPDYMESSSEEIKYTDTPINNDGLHEPDPDDHIKNGMKHEPDPDDSYHEPLHSQTSTMNMDATYPDANDSETSLKSIAPAFEMNVLTEPDPDDLGAPTPELSTLQTYEPDPDDEELQRINGAMTAVCNRLQKALEMLKSEVSPMQSTSILQTLLKIIRNVIEHPEMEKYKRLRKTNPVIERNILNNKAALEILSLVGFREDVIYDNLGKEDAYLVLKRNDPGLLWLAKSTLESSRA